MAAAALEQQERIRPATMAGLRDYVTGEGGGMQQAAESTISMFITHNHLKARFPEIRLDKHMTVGAVKHKVNTMTGTSPATMVLHLKDADGTPVALLDDDGVKLGYYGARDGWTLHVIDTDEASLSAQGWLEDVSKVAKYVMDEEAYAARDNTYRRFRERRLREDPGWTLEKEMCLRRGLPYTPPPPPVGPDHLADAAAKLAPGQRCCVDPGERRGEVRYVGRVEGLADGYWVGVAFDEPLGRNDGSVKGKRFFEAPPGHGAFVRPDRVTAGDFPPVDEFATSDELGSDDEI